MNALFGMYGKTFDETHSRINASDFYYWCIVYKDVYNDIGFYKFLEFIMDKSEEIHFQTAGLKPDKTGITTWELNKVLEVPKRLEKTIFWNGKRRVKTETVLKRFAK